jgi:L-alanine-DL-glutamate epimerase-like enolase superfamily enzyme
MKIAHMAACRDVAVAPHWAPDIHVHHAAATPNCLPVEYFHADVGVTNFDELLLDPLTVRDGHLTPPDRAGHGILVDPDAVRRFQVA